MIQYKCPNCGVSLESPLSLVGQPEECPSCHSQVTVPSATVSGRRRLLWIVSIAAVLLAGGCTALAFWFTRTPETKDRNNENWAVKKEDAPKFASTTHEPVLLRYKFEPGDKFEINADISMIMKIQVESQSIRLPIRMKLVYLCTVDNVTADGKARINAVFTRITAKAAGPRGIINYDSDADEKSDNDDLRYLAAMLNQNVACVVTPRGEISDIDLHLMREAMSRIGAIGSFGEIEKTVDQGFRGAFIQLAEKPVSTGDIYKAGEITNKMANVGTMALDMKYEVLAVSRDKKQVLLKPIVQADIDSLPNPDFRIDSANMDGWVLFNCDRGNIDRSYGKMTMEIFVSKNGQEGTVTMEMAMNYLTTYN